MSQNDFVDINWLRDYTQTRLHAKFQVCSSNRGWATAVWKIPTRFPDFFLSHQLPIFSILFFDPLIFRKVTNSDFDYPWTARVLSILSILCLFLFSFGKRENSRFGQIFELKMCTKVMLLGLWLQLGYLMNISTLLRQLYYKNFKRDSFSCFWDQFEIFLSIASKNQQSVLRNF